MDIELQSVSFAYPAGVPVLDDLDLFIPGGQSVALVGANGSGKTTLARHLNGLLRPSRGRVLVDGADIADRRVADLAASVAVGFQDPDRQVFSRSVRAEVEFGPRRLGFCTERRERAVAAALAATGLAEAADVHPHDLGESRRMLLALASLLAMETAVLVLDEPTVGLDPAGEARVVRAVAALRAAARTVIAISHDMRFAAESLRAHRRARAWPRRPRRQPGRGLRRRLVADPAACRSGAARGRPPRCQTGPRLHALGVGPPGSRARAAPTSEPHSHLTWHGGRQVR